MSILNVKLSVRDYEDVAVKSSWSFGVSIDFQLDSICGVDEAGATAMHFLACRGAQIDKKPELIFGVELLQSYAGVCVFLS